MKVISISASKHENSQEYKQPQDSLGQVLAPSEIWHQLVEKLSVLRGLWRSELQKRTCGPRLWLWLLLATEGSISGQEGSMPPFSCSSNTNPQRNLKRTSYRYSAFHFSTSSDKHCITWFPQPRVRQGRCDHPHITRGKQEPRKGGNSREGRLQDGNQVLPVPEHSDLGQIALGTTLSPTTPSYILIVNLVQWVVDASCLQVGCDFI